MRLIVIVYLLCFCGFLESTTTEILDLPQTILWKIIQWSKKFTVPIPDRNMLIDDNNGQIISRGFYFFQLQQIQKAGFHVEDHTVRTSDGYILTMFRMLQSNIRSNNDLPTVFLQHGAWHSWTSWTTPGKKGLAFILAEEGYDVWMGNFRGNTYSRAHVSLSPSDSKFWNFSFHEMGIYDLPAMISYVTNMTSQPLHAYVGHSVGATASYVMAVERPEITRMMKKMISFSPVAFLEHIKSIIRLAFITPISQIRQVIFKLLGINEILPHTIVTHILMKVLCDPTQIQREICANLLFLIFGFDREQFNTSLMPVITSNYPDGISAKTLEHLGQLYTSGKFCKYDYGRKKNLEIYKSPEPPSYNLPKINTPVALFYAENDWVCNITDVTKLISLLPNVVEQYKVPYSKFNHLDFLWAKDAKQLVYDKLLDII